MKTAIAVILLFASGLLVAQQSTPEPTNSAYPLVLTVMRAQRTTNQGYTTTHIMGYLSDDPNHQQLHMICDGGIFSLDPNGKLGNTYPARYSGKANQIKIQTREMGSNKVHEYTCKY